MVVAVVAVVMMVVFSERCLLQNIFVYFLVLNSSFFPQRFLYTVYLSIEDTRGTGESVRYKIARYIKVIL